ncbi:hypothetical protein Ac2012v2_8354 [Leucoagaricus gongylophorus]
MVAPVRDFGSKFCSFSANTHSQQAFELPTVLPSNYTGMDILSGSSPDNYDEVRGRTFSPKVQVSRDSSMSSTKSSVVYHEKMEHNNALNEDIDMDDDPPALSYKTSQEKAIRVSMVADPNTGTLNKRVTVNHSTTTPQRGPAERPIPPHGDDAVINIQLPYDPYAPTEPDLWDDSDSKSIKDSLNFMAKYIANKQVDPAKSNNLEDFNGIGEAIWNLISSVYQSKWDSLVADKNANTLRQKISAKFTPKIPPPSNRNNKTVDKPIPASIKKIPPLIPAKSQKEVNQISKYFKNTKSVNRSNQPKKSYAQASKQTSNTSEVIKIKDIFPALSAQKIDQIHKIVNSC